MTDSSKIIMIFCTVPDSETAQNISMKLVEEKLAACVNIVESVRSIYWWENAVHDEHEKLLIIKTELSRKAELIKKLKEIHPYDVPEIISIPIESENEEYTKWVISSTETS